MRRRVCAIERRALMLASRVGVAWDTPAALWRASCAAGGMPTWGRVGPARALRANLYCDAPPHAGLPGVQPHDSRPAPPQHGIPLQQAGGARAAGGESAAGGAGRRGLACLRWFAMAGARATQRWLCTATFRDSCFWPPLAASHPWPLCSRCLQACTASQTASSMRTGPRQVPPGLLGLGRLLGQASGTRRGGHCKPRCCCSSCRNTTAVGPG